MIRVLVVDDSALMRRLLAEVFAAAGDFEVSFARDGVEALDALRATNPDVVTLDIQMPRMDGLACLDRIMVEHPRPVVMFSSLTSDGATETMEALSLGAVDFVLKPGGAVSLKVDAFGPELVDKVRAAATARLPRSRRLAERVRLHAGVPDRHPREPRAPPIRSRSMLRTREPAGERLVLIGSSTGGPPALDAVLSDLPADFPFPIVIAQHMPANFTAALARRLDRLCALTVCEVTGPFRLEPGHVYIGRGDADVLISRRDGALIALPAPSSPNHRWHPSVDRLVASAAAVLHPSQMIGVLLTGMGDDGAEALRQAREDGARTIAESQDTAVVWGMPGGLVERGGAEYIERLEDIAGRILRLASL